MYLYFGFNRDRGVCDSTHPQFVGHIVNLYSSYTCIQYINAPIQHIHRIEYLQDPQYTACTPSVSTKLIPAPVRVHIPYIEQYTLEVSPIALSLAHMNPILDLI